MSEHVVVFGLDGVRYDTLLTARTPAIDAVGAAGFLTGVWVNDAAPTISGPGWSTVATGVLADRHGVYDNDLRGNRIAAHPDFLTRVSRAFPRRATYAVGHWPQLVVETEQYGGPIFLGGGSMPYAEELSSKAGWEKADQAAADEAAEVLGGGDVAAAFVYFGLPDVIAHEEGLTADYTASIESSDRRVGQVLAAVRARPGYASERWTVIVVTDHGHVDEVGGHGGDSAAERTAWIAAHGPGLAAGADGLALEQADVHAHVLHALGLEQPAGLTGLPFGRR